MEDNSPVQTWRTTHLSKQLVEVGDVGCCHGRGVAPSALVQRGGAGRGLGAEEVRRRRRVDTLEFDVASHPNTANTP